MLRDNKIKALKKDLLKLLDLNSCKNEFRVLENIKPNYLPFLYS